MFGVSRATECELANSTAADKKEDFTYLQRVKGKTPTATLGAADAKKMKSVKRKLNRSKSNARHPAKKQRTSMKSTHITQRTDNDEHDDPIEVQEDPNDGDFVPPKMRETTKRRIATAKKTQVITPAVCSIGEKYAMSNRQVFEMIGAVTVSCPT